MSKVFRFQNQRYLFAFVLCASTPALMVGCATVGPALAALGVAFGQDLMASAAVNYTPRYAMQTEVLLNSIATQLTGIQTQPQLARYGYQPPPPKYMQKQRQEQYGQNAYGDPYGNNTYGNPYGSNPYGNDPYASNDPYAQTYPQGDPYAQQGNPYGQDPYAQQGSPNAQDPYAQQGNPYGQQADPYSQSDPYAQQGGTYGQQGGYGQNDPYAQQSTPYNQGDPYAQQTTPYGQGDPQQGTSYGQSDPNAQQGDPYGQQGGYGQNDPYAQQSTPYDQGDPYAQQGDPYGQQGGYGQNDPNAQQGTAYGQGDPYAQQNDPYAQQPSANPQGGDPYAQQGGPYGQGNPYAMRSASGNAPISLDAALFVQRAGSAVLQQMKDGDVLNDGRGNPAAGDVIKVHFSTDCACYVYIIGIDATGYVAQIYPDPDAQHTNPVNPNAQYRLPEGNDWWGLDEYRGIEQVYFIASRERLTDIENALAQLASQPRRTQVANYQPVTQPAIFRTTRGLVKVSLADPVEVNTSGGPTQQIAPTNYLLDAAANSLVVTRWFQHR